MIRFAGLLIRGVAATFVGIRGKSALQPDEGRLQRLPDSLRMRLVDALERLDVRGIESALDEVRRVDAVAAESLQPLARQFDYEGLKALLQQPG